jgi:DNA ligase-associated metallophosphoesterase
MTSEAAQILATFDDPAIRVGALAFTGDPCGALYLAEERMLVVADLHFEKGSAFGSRGVFLPPYDTRATLAVLARVIARYRPTRVIALGDSLHDGRADERIDANDRETLRDLQTGRDWIWVTGNHDPDIPRALGGEVADSLVHGGVIFRHEPSTGAAAEIAGHLHPVAKVRLRGRSVRRRCFAASAKRCVLPAFGAYAGGLNVRDRAFRDLFPDAFTAHVLGTERLFAIDRAMLLPD